MYIRGIMLGENDTFWEKEYQEFSEIPDEVEQPVEQKPRPLSAKIFANGIGLIVTCIAVYLPISFVMLQGNLVMPLTLIFIGMGIIGGFFMFLACYNWPIEKIY